MSVYVNSMKYQKHTTADRANRRWLAVEYGAIETDDKRRRT